jgi:transposase-like protein
MKTTFKSLIELNDYFKEEKTCFEFLASQIWDEGKPVCPFCGSTHVYTTKSRSTKPSKKDVPEYRCADKNCAKKFSATTGTIFQSSKIPLRTWYAAIFLLTTSKKGISSIQLGTQLGVTQKTAWFLNHRIRQMFLDTAPDMLTGIVEVDETFVGGKNHNRHLSKKTNYEKGEVDKTAVLGILQRNGKVKTFVVPNTSAEVLQPIMLDNVETGATLISDNWKSYWGLKDTYNHIRVKHVINDYRTDSHFHTNNIENFWSTFKRGIIGIYHQVSPKHLHRYTTEFGYRYNNRQETSNIKFEDAITGSNKKTLTYQKLIGGVTNQTLNQISTTFAEKKPEQDFTDLLDNPDTSIPE